MSKLRERLRQHLAIVALWVNYCRGITNRTGTTPAQALGLAPRRYREEEVIAWREDLGRLSFGFSADWNVVPDLHVIPAFLAESHVELRAAADASFWLAALSGFCGAGWFAGRSLGVGRRRECALAGAFLAAGLLVAPAFRELQGLTGHESVLVVAASTLPAFGAAMSTTGRWISSNSRYMTSAICREFPEAR